MRRILTFLFVALACVLAIPLSPPAAHAATAVLPGAHVQLMLSIALPAIIVSALSLILPLLVGPVSVQIGRVVLNLTAWIDKLPALVKQIVSAIITVLLTVAALKIGHPLPDTLAGVNTDAIVSLLNMGIAFLLHHVIKVKESGALAS